MVVHKTLEQEGEDGQWHIVAYGSHSLTNSEEVVNDREECFAIVHFMNHWQHFQFSLIPCFSYTQIGIHAINGQ